MKAKKPNRYQALIETIFLASYRKGKDTIPFTREELLANADVLGIRLPKNPGDILYSFRYRNPLPPKILATQPPGKEWVIEGKGRARYEFHLVPINRIEPNPNLVTIKIPDATPEIIRVNSLSDEQALLAKVRYNRIIDTFLGITTYSLQNHLRTTVKGMGQIEIDEVYVGVDRHGCQYHPRPGKGRQRPTWYGSGQAGHRLLRREISKPYLPRNLRTVHGRQQNRSLRTLPR